MNITKLDIESILRLAAERGISDEEICNSAGVHCITLYRWRTGKCRPHVSTLAKLIKRINCD